jgi:succinate-acetate transporter protein
VARTVTSEPLETTRRPAQSDGGQPVPIDPVRIADPAGLGLAGFALTTFMLSMVNANWINEGVEPAVFGMALAVGGLAQLLAGMWEFRSGNAFGATAFSGFGAFWLSFWALVQFYLPKIPADQVGHAVGLYLLTWAGFTAYMLIASFGVSRAVNAVFLLLLPTFILLGIGNYGAHETLIHWGGYFGVATAVAAVYASAASVTNATFGRIILPTKPLTRTTTTTTVAR